MPNDLNLCGWRVHSELPLPELPPYRGAERPVDIHVRIGEVPGDAAEGWRGGPVLQVDSTGACRFSIRNVARYLVRDGREIIVDPLAPPEAPDIALFLLGTGLGVLCHQRNVLPLHASCLAFGDSAIAFSGDSGSGKSTIAAALLRNGAKLVSDDVTVVDVYAPGGPMVLPSFPRQKLWRDTLTALRLQPGRALRTTVDMEKFERPAADVFHPTPIRLTQICQLHFAPLQNGGTLEPLSGVQAFDAVQDHVYRYRAALLMGLGKQVFRQSAALASSVRLHSLANRFGLEALLERAQAFPQMLGVGA